MHQGHDTDNQHRSLHAPNPGAASGQHDRLHLGIGAGAVDAVETAAAHGGAEGVDGRAVDRDDGDDVMNVTHANPIEDNSVGPIPVDSPPRDDDGDDAMNMTQTDPIGDNSGVGVPDVTTHAVSAVHATHENNSDSFGILPDVSLDLYHDSSDDSEFENKKYHEQFTFDFVITPDPATVGSLQTIW